MEKQKSRLQSEVEILIIDLEKANNTARELQKRVEHLEKINIEIKSRLDETTALYETSQRDLRNKQTEIQRLTHELDKTREQKDALSRENKKLSGKHFLNDFLCGAEWRSRDFRLGWFSTILRILISRKTNFQIRFSERLF